MKAIDERIEELLTKRVIKRANSPWGSPLLILPKKDGTLRVVQDLKGLNARLKIGGYPLPRIDQILSECAGKQVFSAFDALSGFWQSALDEESQVLTAFPTHQGQFQWTVLPQGCAVSPGLFQAEMNRIFGPAL